MLREMQEIQEKYQNLKTVYKRRKTKIFEEMYTYLSKNWNAKEIYNTNWYEKKAKNPVISFIIGNFLVELSKRELNILELK